jgi:rod shape determining protein RodA
MFSHLKLYLKNFDWIIFSAILLLVAFGLIEIYSVALGQNSADLLNFKKQVIFALLGFAGLFIFAFIDYYSLKNLSRYFYILGALFLVAVLLLGHNIRGHQGWITLSGFNLQPVEPVKVILILALASFFANLSTKVKTTRHFLLSAIMVSFLIALVLLQPDLGSAIILGAIWLIMIMAAGFNKKYLLIVTLAVAVFFVLAWFLMFKDYQKARIINFINPGVNTQQSGYNISQAMIAVGSGGLTGKGVGLGSQSQLKFLPEAHTDFIFSVIAEELGFLGVFLVLSFYAVFLWRCFRILPKINNDFGVYFLIGAAGLIFVQMFINIGMNLGIMPIVGLPLPFISYGGSSLVSLLVVVGIIENIIIKSKISY